MEFELPRGSQREVVRPLRPTVVVRPLRPTVERAQRAQHTTVGWAARTCGSHAMSFGQPDSVLLYSVPLAWPQERYPETAVRKLGLANHEGSPSRACGQSSQGQIVVDRFAPPILNRGRTHRSPTLAAPPGVPGGAGRWYMGVVALFPSQAVSEAGVRRALVRSCSPEAAPVV